MKKLSILIPVYNENKTVEKLILKVDQVSVGLEKEVVMVDDGSADGTVEVLKKLESKYPTWKFLYQEKNAGKGAALRTAIKAATGDILLIQDADLEYDPNDYNALLKPILEGHADVVYGSRFLGGGPHRVVYFWHYVGNKIITLISNMRTNLNLSDIEVCYKAFKKEVLQGIEIKENRFGVEVELTAKMAKGKWRIYEVPIAYYGRTYAEGKKINWKDGVSALRCLLKY